MRSFSFLLFIVAINSASVSAWVPSCLSRSSAKASCTQRLEANDSSNEPSLEGVAPSRRAVLQETFFKGMVLCTGSWMMASVPSLADEGSDAPVVASAPAAEESTKEESPPAPESTTSTAGDDDAANEFIAKLKAKSDAKREEYLQQAQRPDKLSGRQFKSQYDRPSYVGVRHDEDGSGRVEMLLRSEVDKLMASGKIDQQYDTIVNEKTGETKPDYKKGKIYVFKK